MPPVLAPANANELGLFSMPSFYNSPGTRQAAWNANSTNIELEGMHLSMKLFEPVRKRQGIILLIFTTIITLRKTLQQ